MEKIEWEKGDRIFMELLSKKFRDFLIALFLANVIIFTIAAFDLPILRSIQPILLEFMTFDVTNPAFRDAAVYVIFINTFFVEAGFVALSTRVLDR